MDPTLVRYYKLRRSESQVMNYIWVEPLNTCGSEPSRVDILTNLDVGGMFFQYLAPLVIGKKYVFAVECSGRNDDFWKEYKPTVRRKSRLDLKAADIISS